MRVIILSAGFGTRMYPLTKDKSKGLLEYKGKPVMTHIVDEVRKIKDLEGILVVVNAKFYMSYLHWKSEIDYPIELFSTGVSDVKKVNGAVQDLKNALNRLHYWDKDVLVLACDYIYEGLEGMQEFFKRKRKSIGAVLDEPGNAVLNVYGRVLNLYEGKHEQGFPHVIPAYMLTREDLQVVKHYEKGDGKGNLVDCLLTSGREVYTYPNLKAVRTETLIK